MVLMVVVVMEMERREMMMVVNDHVGGEMVEVVEEVQEEPAC